MSETQRASAKAMVFRVEERHQQLRFVLAGVWNTAFGYLAFLIAYAAIGGGLGSVPALLVGYAIALPQSYTVQRYLVFRSRSAWRGQFLRFATANTVVFVANLLLLPVVIALSQADPRIIQAFFVGFSTIASYLAHKHFSFK